MILILLIIVNLAWCDQVQVNGVVGCWVYQPSDDNVDDTRYNRRTGQTRLLLVVFYDHFRIKLTEILCTKMKPSPYPPSQNNKGFLRKYDKIPGKIRNLRKLPSSPTQISSWRKILRRNFKTRSSIFLAIILIQYGVSTNQLILKYIVGEE